ncbi:phosphate ABC transporter substrate-binding protein PstS family protein [Halomontanus rarus]|uniref:phosphate ABC transporter substrate-binding protein PstS family protein n=1 Tax=Halomontanus rarus TaxID=3034020 RepID=UPI0023E78E6F|nr:phosphate ABC transporter substrate-binding protein PstS family protein [Halovivax sp. TS33]
MTDTKMDRTVRSFSRRKFLAATGTVGALSFAGCTENNDGDDGEMGEVIVTGSSTVHPVSDTMAERFMEENDVNVTTDPTGTGGGFANNFCPGSSDVNGASRPIQPEEEDSCSENDINPIEFRIAGDAITMAVNPDNTAVDQISFDELTQIWQEDAAETWQDVNSDWPDEEILRYGPDTTSGTFDWFTENVVGEAGNHTDDYEPTEDDNTIVNNISQNEYAIGYFGYSYFRENEDRLKALEVSESDDSYTAPDLDAAQSGEYPMARPLFIYVSEDSLANEPVYDFVEYYLDSSDDDFIADDIGYVPSNSDQVEENLSKLEEYA